MENLIKSYKGFNKDMTCKDKQYEEGKEYTEERAKACDCGMHACEYPLDCFKYYDPAHSVYHAVEQGGDLSKNGDDSKVASTYMRIGARLDVCGLVKAANEYTRSRTTTEYTDPDMATAGDSGAATAGNSGAATAGDSGAATAGYRGAATAGNFGAATAGDFGAATAGDFGAATSRGKSASGENGLSVARGNEVRVKGGMGALLVIAEENTSDYDISEWKAVVVDGEKIKPDTWYKLEDGELVEESE